MTNRSCVIRLSRYKNALLRLRALKFVRVFSENLADAAGVSATQVRKDFSIFGIRGNRRGGYQVAELLEQLSRILGKDRVHDFVLVGAGNLGRALLNYGGFEVAGLRIAAGFDIDAARFQPETDVPVLPLDQLDGYVRDRQIALAIIAVPDTAAQQVLDLLLAAGIKGVLNFAPICLKAPEGCVLSNINLVTELENIIYFVNTAAQGTEEA